MLPNYLTWKPFLFAQDFPSLSHMFWCETVSGWAASKGSIPTELLPSNQNPLSLLQQPNFGVFGLLKDPINMAKLWNYIPDTLGISTELWEDRTLKLKFCPEPPLFQECRTTYGNWQRRKRVCLCWLSASSHLSTSASFLYIIILVKYIVKMKMGSGLAAADVIM